MNKALLLISLLIANLQALPESMPSSQKPFPFTTDKKQGLPQVSKRRAFEDLVPEKKEHDSSSFIAHQEDNAPLIPRKVFFAKDYTHGQIVITITGVKTDSLVATSERGDGIYTNTTTHKIMRENDINIEDDHQIIAHIALAEINTYHYKMFLEVYDDSSNGSKYLPDQDLYGECSYCQDFQISYSKQQQTITIVIPFKFARKVLPVNLIK